MHHEPASTWRSTALIGWILWWIVDDQSVHPAALEGIFEPLLVLLSIAMSRWSACSPSVQQNRGWTDDACVGLQLQNFSSTSGLRAVLARWNLQTKWRVEQGLSRRVVAGCAMNAFPKTRTQVQGWIKGRLVHMAVLLVSVSTATGQTTAGPVTPKFRDADLTEIAKAVSAATGKNVIIDPRIHVRATMISSKEMSSAAFYDVFLSVVRVHCLVAKTAGNVVTILPDPKSGSSCSPVPL
jgi:hypothetical protein